MEPYVKHSSSSSSSHSNEQLNYARQIRSIQNVSQQPPQKPKKTSSQQRAEQPNQKRQPQHKQQQQQQQQHQQQKQQDRYPSPHALTLDIRSQPPTPRKPKHRQYDEINQQPSSEKHRQKSGKIDKQRQIRDRTLPDTKRNIRGVHINSKGQRHDIIVPYDPNSSTDINPCYGVTSQPRPSHAVKQSSTPYGKAASTNTGFSKSKQIGAQTPCRYKENTKDRPNMTGSLAQNMKPSKNSICALEAGIPEQFCGTPDDKNNIIDSTTTASNTANTTTDVKKSKKLSNHDLTNIPQTNLSVGLIVFCCFNPVFGALAIYLSLAAAKAYRDGWESKGHSRAHWSILISLFGITVTMVIVSTLVVVFSMTKHSNSQYRHATSQALGF